MRFAFGTKGTASDGGQPGGGENLGTGMSFGKADPAALDVPKTETPVEAGGAAVCEDEVARRELPNGELCGAWTSSFFVAVTPLGSGTWLAVGASTCVLAAVEKTLGSKRERPLCGGGASGAAAACAAASARSRSSCLTVESGVAALG